MKTRDLRLWEILQRAEKGNALSTDDLSFAESRLDDPDPRSQTHACTIIFRCSKSSSSKSRALDTIERLCAKPVDENYTMRLLIAMMYVPLSALKKGTSLRECVVESAGSNQVGIRTNVSFVLGRLAKSGDSEAIGLLRLLTKDSDNYVKENAQITLRQLGKGA